jgi:hypothetical protein
MHIKYVYLYRNVWTSLFLKRKVTKRKITKASEKSEAFLLQTVDHKNT